MTIEELSKEEMQARIVRDARPAPIDYPRWLGRMLGHVEYLLTATKYSGASKAAIINDVRELNFQLKKPR